MRFVPKDNMTPLQMKIYQKKYRKSHKVERKAYYQNNAVRIKAYYQKYSQSHQVQMKIYQKNNKAIKKKYMKKYYQNNAVEIKAYSKESHRQFPWRRTFAGIKNRCTNKNSPTYKNRLGDITSDQLKAIWLRDQAYLMVRPSIDRIDNDGVYTKSNLRYIEASDHAVKTGNETRQRKDKNKK